jgi:Flp pilus assembly protein TadD
MDIATNLAIAAALGRDSEKAVKVAAQITGSPTATAVHRRNLVIVYGIIGRTSDEARAVAPGDLKPAEFSKLFDRAGAIRKITDPAKRAQAVGTIQGG